MVRLIRGKKPNPDKKCHVCGKPKCDGVFGSDSKGFHKKCFRKWFKKGLKVAYDKKFLRIDTKQGKLKAGKNLPEN